MVPGLVASIYNRFQAGDLAGALKAQDELAPLRHAFDLGTFPVVIKEALNIMGIPAGRCRAPVGNLGPAQREQLVAVLKGLKVI